MNEPVTSTAGGGAARGEAEQVVVRRLAKRLRRGQDVRRRKVRRVKLSVQAGAYENDLKLIIALERMLESLRR